MLVEVVVVVTLSQVEVASSKKVTFASAGLGCSCLVVLPSGEEAFVPRAILPSFVNVILTGFSVSLMGVSEVL